MNATLKIPTAFPLLIGGSTVGIFTFWDVYMQTSFSGLHIQISKRLGL